MTALYPRLRTMTPVPEMTYPGSENTFPPGTPLYPNASCIEQYHQGFARKQGLYRHIKFNHTISSTEWRGNRTMGHWNLAYTAGGKVHYGSFDHLVVAAGAFRVPSVPSWRGQESWLAYRKHRQMLHSVYYTIAEEYRGAKVLVVGSGPSGRDIARKLADFAEVSALVRFPVSRHLSLCVGTYVCKTRALCPNRPPGRPSSRHHTFY
jgi:cation diffusion facilitator CzcD-associated flavoprotein CzcO